MSQSPEPEYSRPSTPEECIDRAITAMVESEKTANAGVIAVTHVGLAIAHGWVAVARGMSGLPVLLESTAATEFFRGELSEHQAPSLPPLCTAHGTVACPRCSRNPEPCLSDPGSGCTTYAEDGMHWDTCPHRDRSPIQLAPHPRPWSNPEGPLSTEAKAMLASSVRHDDAESPENPRP